LEVGTITGRMFSVEVLPTDTVGDVKRRIEEEEAIPSEAQVLIFREKHLADDNVPVRQIGIQDGSRLQLTVEMAGG
ncbi:ubiquitin-related domain-containing protein, partial [Zopfochytrium polystomum]